MASCTATTPFATVDYQDGVTDFSAVHSDIIQNHILKLLDGPTLASAACASSQLHALSTEEKLWRNICASTWPSTDHPRLRHLISSFPAGYRSFFSDSFPALDHLSRPKNPDRSCLPPVLLSAVDVHYEDELIFSRVLETQTRNQDWVVPLRAFPYRLAWPERDDSNIDTKRRRRPSVAQAPGGEFDPKLDRDRSDTKEGGECVQPTTRFCGAPLVDRRYTAPIRDDHGWEYVDVRVRAVRRGGQVRGEGGN
ncbi:hypothetical protein CJ030_MR1G029033 [Morella rubra]|uniref:F-box domain-containing protein n=1 Tax=Morella rubra TaxID=262757 RepID=A0A6A1WTT4_9ROSI|nr:hypothetical protein CJ030_MR1G029033 [Morella rubra]